MVARLPPRLPDEKTFQWQTRLTSEGIGGISANREYVVAGSRNLLDNADVFTCHRMSDGAEVWRVEYPAAGELDYGNSPRATPLIVQDKVVLLGAFGHLTTVDLASGEQLWQIEFELEFDCEIPTWGFCGSPVAIDLATRPLVVVQPGAADASLVAFDLESGEVAWQSPGGPPGYSSLVVARIGGKSQLIGYDATSVGGWSLRGERLWSLTPPARGDFNVPTPIWTGQHLFLATENNGARLYRFDERDRLDPQPVARHRDLSPDTHSPVLAGELICGTSGGLYCLDRQSLKEIHAGFLDVFEEYTSIISDGGTRLLVTTQQGELVLLHVDRETCKIVGRMQLTGGEEILAHPALVDDRLIVRFGRKLVCLKLN